MPFLQKAIECSVCGKRMGYLSGIHGFGIRATGHATRCQARIERERARAVAALADLSGKDDALTLAEMATLLASANDADTEATLASINADGRAKLMHALGAEGEVPTKPVAGERVYNLADMTALLASATDADTEVALASITVDVRAELMDALVAEGKVAIKPLEGEKVYTLTEMAILLASANDADTEAALTSINADVRRKLMGALEADGKVSTKPLADAQVYTLAEMLSLLASANDADTEVALASVNADVRAKLADALGDAATVATKPKVGGRVYTLVQKWLFFSLAEA